MYERKFKLRMVISNFSKLKILFSKPEEHFGVPWSLNIARGEDDDDENYRALLWCQKDKDDAHPWSIDTTFSFTFPSVSSTQLPVENVTHKFTERGGRGFSSVHPREKLLEAAVGDTLIFECSVTINEMTGIAPKRRNFEERKKPTEVALNMGNRSFNVSKKFLAANFTYFNGLLFGGFRESQEKKLKLEDVDPELFHRILEFIDARLILPEDKLVEILELSLFLGAESVVAPYEKAIVEDNRIANNVKFRLADTHNLLFLKNNCLNNINDLESLRAHSPKYIFDLNQSFLAQIMHKIIHGFGVHAGPKDQKDAPVRTVERKFKLRHVVKNFSGLKEEYSEPEEHFGNEWELGFEKEASGNFGCFLYCIRKKDDKKPWEIQANYKFTFPCINAKHLQSHTLSYTFVEADGWGQTRPADWYLPTVVDDVLVVECAVEITKMTGIPRKKTLSFDEPMESETAITLEVGDQNFHLSKKFLSFHSTYFKSLYSNEGAKQPEVDLKELNAEDFQVLLEVLHDYQVLDDDNVIGVLKLAVLLGVPKVLHQCEKMIIGSGKVTMKEKLRLADEHNLQQLMFHCLNNTSTFSDLKAYMPINVFDLQKNTLAMFLNKVINHF